MLLKLGVDISRLNREIRRALNVIEDVYQKLFNEEPVITSTYESNHENASLHYHNDAIDVRLRQKYISTLKRDVKKRLGINFDVVIEVDHMHVEYDPK